MFVAAGNKERGEEHFYYDSKKYSIMNKYTAILILLFLNIFWGCKKNEISESEIKEATNFVVNQFIPQKFNDYYLSSKFNNKLNRDIISHDLLQNDKNISKDDIECFSSQYNKNAGASISKFIEDSQFYSLIDLDNDSISTIIGKKLLIEFGIPMFTKDKSHFMIYAFSSFALPENKRGWDDIYWFFCKENESWKYSGAIKRH